MTSLRPTWRRPSNLAAWSCTGIISQLHASVPAKSRPVGLALGRYRQEKRKFLLTSVEGPSEIGSPIIVGAGLDPI
eukprot:4727757-Pleurochrysis_carterae.AAC.4